jgi:phosphatidylinositol phospholipase C, delta
VQAADSQNRGYLDFVDFRKFVKTLKTRPELERLFKRLVANSGSTDGYLRYAAFEDFMLKQQKVHYHFSI